MLYIEDRAGTNLSVENTCKCRVLLVTKQVDCSVCHEKELNIQVESVHLCFMHFEVVHN